MIRKMIIAIFVCLVLGCILHELVEESFCQDRIYPLNEFRMLREPSDISGSVAYLLPGDTIPLKLNLEGEWFAIVPGEVDLVAKQKIFLRVALPKDISRERTAKLVSLDEQKLLEMSASERAALFEGVMLYLSKDAVKWAPLNDKEAIKEAFGIQEGKLSAGMGMNAAEGLWLALQLETVKK